jgi:hypothetical protein
MAVSWSGASGATPVVSPLDQHPSTCRLWRADLGERSLHRLRGDDAFRQAAPKPEPEKAAAEDDREGRSAKDTNSYWA